MSASSTDPVTGGLRRVLVAYDGSPRAADALALAVRLREPTAGSLTLACVRVRHRPWDHARHDDSASDPDSDAAEAMLTEARHRVAPGVHVRVLQLVAASPARGLTEAAEAEQADLVVVGSSPPAAPRAAL
jgi:nucleotide-binding universal stress UspA family protein